MRLTATLFLSLFLAAAAQAQQAPADGGPPGLAVVKCGWSKELIPGWENRGGGAEPYEVMIARLANEQRLQRARNAGDKASIARSEREAKVYEKANANNGAKSSKPSRFGYRYKVSIRNGGPKAVKSVDWDYVFLDPETQAEVERHQFTSDEKIGPGKEKELAVFNLAPPTRTISARASGRKDAPPFVERIILVRVEYADGSAWPGK
jgi:hypothetical protein